MKKQKRLTEKLLVLFTPEQMNSLREISDSSGRKMADIIRIALSEWTNKYDQSVVIASRKKKNANRK